MAFGSAVAGFLGSTTAGAVLGEVLVRIGVDTKPLMAGLTQAEAATTSAASNMEKTSASANLMKAAWVTAALGAGAALVAFGAKGVMAAASLEEAINSASKTFGSAKSIVLDFASTTANSIGLTQAEALQAATSFGAMFQNLGVVNTEAAEMSNNLIQMAADMGSFRDVDPSEMLERFRSGLAGEVEALRRFGINLSAARVEQEAYRIGLANVGEELTEQDKLMARYSLLVKETAAAQNDFRETADSIPNRLRELGATLNDTAASFGQNLMPAVKASLGVLLNLVKVLGFLSQFVIQVGAGFATWLVLKSLPTMILGVAAALEKMAMAKAANAVANFGSRLGFLAANAGVIGAAVGGIAFAVSMIAKEAADAADETERLATEYIKLQNAGDSAGAARLKSGIDDTQPAFKAPVQAATDLDRFNSKVKELTSAEEEAVAAVEATNKQIDLTAKLAGPASDVLDLMGVSARDFAKEAKAAANESTAAFEAFSIETLNNAKAAFEEWRAQTAASLNFVASKFQELAGKSNVSMSSLINGMRKTFAAQREFGNNIETIARRAQRMGVDVDGLIDQLIQMGPEGAKAAQVIASAHKRRFAELAGVWSKAESNANGTARSIQSVMVGALRDIRDILAAIAKKWNVDVQLRDHASAGISALEAKLRAITGTHTVTVVENHIFTGVGGNFRGGDASGAFYMNTMAQGGFLTRGPTLVGEGAYATRFGRGGEAVLPLNSSTLARLGKAIREADGARHARSGPTVKVYVQNAFGQDLDKVVEDALRRRLSKMGAV